MRFDFPLCCADLTARHLFCFLAHLVIFRSAQFFPSFPIFFCPRALLSRVSYLGESGVTTLVKEPDAELIIVIKASCLHNMSQAEGAQSSFPAPCRRSCPGPALLSCCFPRDLEQRPGSSTCSCHTGVSQMREGGSSAGQEEHQSGLQRICRLGSFPGPNKSVP